MTLTAAERVELLSADHVDYKLEAIVVDPDEGAVLDISDSISECVVTHSNFASVHRSVHLNTTARLDWGRHRLQVYSLIAGSNGLSDRVPMGQFALTWPTDRGGQTPSTFEVDGFDLLYLLDQHLTAIWTAPAGQPVLFLARDLLRSAGLPRVRIDSSRGGQLVEQAMTFVPGEERGTTLGVINALLESVSYGGVHMDPVGVPQAAPYTPPAGQPIVWVYDAADAHTIVQPEREVDGNLTDTPNYWRFWMADVERDTPAQPNDGLYIVRNDDVGPASINARGGLVVPKDPAECGLYAQTQADLEAFGDRIVDVDIRSHATVNLSTLLNPYHGHMDVVAVFDGDLGLAQRFQHVTWTGDVVAGAMTHECRAVEGTVG